MDVLFQLVFCCCCCCCCCSGSGSRRAATSRPRRRPRRRRKGVVRDERAGPRARLCTASPHPRPAAGAAHLYEWDIPVRARAPAEATAHLARSAAGSAFLHQPSTAGVAALPAREPGNARPPSQGPGTRGLSRGSPGDTRARADRGGPSYSFDPGRTPGALLEFPGPEPVLAAVAVAFTACWAAPARELAQRWIFRVTVYKI